MQQRFSEGNPVNHSGFTILLILTSFFISCSDQDKSSAPETPSGIRAAVFLSAGDLYPKFNLYEVPTFFNLGKILTEQEFQLDALILCERLRKGSKIDILPLAMFSFELHGIEHRYIISAPTGEQYALFGSNYSEFIINNISLQSNIENWFAAQCPQNACRNFTWQNSYKALLEINKYNKKIQ